MVGSRSVNFGLLSKELFWGFTAYGLGLFLIGLLFTQGGHGSTLPLKASGSPLSLFLFPYSTIAFWALLGLFLSRGRQQPAMVWLALHLVAMPLVLGLGDPDFEQDWTLAVRSVSQEPLLATALLSVHPVGYLGGWWLAATRWRKRDDIASDPSVER